MYNLVKNKYNLVKNMYTQVFIGNLSCLKLTEHIDR